MCTHVGDSGDLQQRADGRRLHTARKVGGAWQQAAHAKPRDALAALGIVRIVGEVRDSLL